MLKLSSEVLVVFALAFVSSVANVLVEWTSLPYLQHIGLATKTDLSFFYTLSSLTLLAPVPAGALLGLLSARHGPARVLAAGLCALALGTALLAVLRSSRAAVAAAWTLYAVNPALRVVRLAVLADLVPVRDRTLVMALHSLMPPLGTLVGPVVWLGVNTLPRRLALFPQVGLDHYVILFALVSLTTALSSVLAFSLARRIHRVAVGGTPAASDAAQPLQDYGSVGADVSVHLEPTTHDVKPWRRVLVAGTILVLGRFSGLIAYNSFQAIMVKQFDATETQLGHIYLVVAVLALAPPLMVGVLSRRLRDRELLAIGLVCKTCGAALYMPVFGALREWQAVVGLVLIIKAVVFFATATLSLVSKMLDGCGSAMALGLVWGASAMLPAVVQLGFAEWLADSLGTWRFAPLMMPAPVALALTMHPAVWKMLDG